MFICSVSSWGLPKLFFLSSSSVQTSKVIFFLSQPDLFEQHQFAFGGTMFICSPFNPPVAQKFAGWGAGGVSGVGGEGEAGGRRALSDAVTAGFTHEHPGQGDVGSSPQRPVRHQEAQVRKQERGRLVAEWLLRTQDGQNRNHQRDGLLKAGSRTVMVSS